MNSNLLARLCMIWLLVGSTNAARAADPAAPANIDKLMEQATEAMSAGKTEQALELAHQAVVAAPRDVRPILLRLAIYQQAGEWSKALPQADRALTLEPELTSVRMTRGVAHFMVGDFDESVKDFDAVAAARPADAPHLWQRGIALYYAGRFDDGAKQFEDHHKVNPDDVENSAWHFACVAHAKNIDAAKKVLIPSRGDERVPMMKVLELFAGKATPDDVIAAATAGNPNPATLNRQLFYAHLYVGLYYDATGDAAKAKHHITTAAEKHPLTDYMHGVAAIHAKRFAQAGQKK